MFVSLAEANVSGDTPASSYAGSTVAATYPPPSATNTKIDYLFPPASQVGFAGATATGAEPSAIETASFVMVLSSPLAALVSLSYASNIHAAATKHGFIVTGPLEFLSTWTYKPGAAILTPFGRQALFNTGVAFRYRFVRHGQVSVLF